MNKLDFLRLYDSDNTIITYKQAIKKYLEFLYRTSFKTEDLESHASRYIDEKRPIEQIQRDVEDFYVFIKGAPPKTRMTKLAAINKFLYKNGVRIDPLFWEDLRDKIGGKKAITRVKIPTKTELRNICDHLDLRGKVMALMLSSGGIRIGELLNIRLADVDINSNPVRVWISSGKHRTKSGTSRLTFISSEVKPLLIQYLKEREAQQKAAYERSIKMVQYNKKEGKVRHLPNPNDDRLFPFTIAVFGRDWACALDKTGLSVKDTATGLTLYHIHVLRKFFRTNFGNPDVAEFLMGHTGYLTNEYRNFNEEQLAESFSSDHHQDTMAFFNKLM